MRPGLLRLSSVLLVSGLFCATSSGQIPGMPPTANRIEVAEVRGATSDQGSPDAAFQAGTASQPFASNVVVAAVRFKAQTPPDDPEIRIVVTYLPTAGGSQVVLSESVTGEELRTGATLLLRNNGAPLNPGRYQASVMGSGSRIFRTVEFTVKNPPPVRRKPTTRPGGTANAEPETNDLTEFSTPYKLNEIAFRYPARYGVVPVRREGENTVLLADTSPGSGIFVSVKNSGGFAFDRDSISLRNSIVKATGNTAFGAWRAFRLDPLTIGGHQFVGKTYVAKANAATCQVVVHAVEIDGVSVMVGFISKTDSPKAGASSGKVGEPGQIGEDMYRLIQTMRTDSAGRTPDEDISPQSVALR